MRNTSVTSGAQCRPGSSIAIAIANKVHSPVCTSLPPAATRGVSGLPLYDSDRWTQRWRLTEPLGDTHHCRSHQFRVTSHRWPGRPGIVVVIVVWLWSWLTIPIAGIPVPDVTTPPTAATHPILSVSCVLGGVQLSPVVVCSSQDSSCE